jgi:hypothetical protein
MPQTSFGGEYLHKDLFEMAAAYLYHVTQTILSWMAIKEPAPPSQLFFSQSTILN